MSWKMKISSDQHRIAAPFQPDDEVMPGMRFGREDELLSPAYWVMRCASADPVDIDFVNRHGTLEEEIGFCLLGGFSVTFEVASAFYSRLKKEGVFEPQAVVSEGTIHSLLAVPATVNGRPHKYRFPNQRARRIHNALKTLSEIDLDTRSPVAFRDQLQALEGVGPKTASWIARNWFDTDDVAILDIHVLRAGKFMNLFNENLSLPKDYPSLESKFIKFSKELHVRTSVLDAVMWSDMRKFGSGLVRMREIE